MCVRIHGVSPPQSLYNWLEVIAMRNGSQPPEGEKISGPVRGIGAKVLRRLRVPLLAPDGGGSRGGGGGKDLHESS